MAVLLDSSWRREIHAKIQNMLSIRILTSAFLILTLIQFSSGANDLQITKVTSPTSAQLQITWTSTSSSTSYFMLELRVVNNTAIALVSSLATTTTRSKLVQGLRAGTFYNVSVKSYTVSGALISAASVQTQTVPATPVINTTNGISSSEISLTWNTQVGVDYYFLMVSIGSDSINKTFTDTLNGTVDGLQPSTVYNLTLYAVNSAGPSTASRRVSVYTLTQAPGGITVTPVSSSTVALTWGRVDNALMYGIFVYEAGPTNNLLYIMKTTTVTITLNNLQPCTKYVFDIASYNWFYVIGGKTEVLYKYGNLDPPQGVTIQYSSYMQSALISWVPSTAASIYVATATSDKGHVASCNTSTTSCEIQDLRCEQTYVVSVMAETGTCYSNSSKQSTVQTAHCAPQNITVTDDCQVNTIMLQWSPTVNAVQYTAFAITPDQHKLECRNVVPNCFFINLLCGTEYEMSVMANYATTNSCRSHGIIARTAPCDPVNVIAVPNCNNSVLDVSWDQSNGATTYMAVAQGSSGFTYNCSSVSTSCQITGVQCGDSVSVTVIASDNYCSSWSSSTDEIVTAPCAPAFITTETDCKGGTTSVQWMYSEGALLYTARAVSAIDNAEYSCQSSALLCTLNDLPCGEMFTVSVKATNFQCDSGYSQEVEIFSVPCTPSSVYSELNCALNTVLVKWSDYSINATYTATIEEKGIGFHSCTTQGSYCEVHDLSCGQNYSVSVKADNGHCTSSSNWTDSSFTAPCKPTQIKANSICYNNSMQMTWSKNQAFGIDMYLVQMQSSSGQQIACQSTSEVCIAEGIQCGTIYEVTVTAVSDNCESISSIIYTDQVPCSPKQLTDTVAPDLVVLNWNSVPGALNYTTEVSDGVIERHNCNTINTSCSMMDLLCGHQYSMLVTAFGQQCSNVSNTHQFQTAPCVPQNVLANLDCVTNVATISWNSSLGANNYTTIAKGTDGQTYFCNSTSTSCVIVGLKCGYSYQVTVEATNEKSKSGPSIPVPIVTAPCVPVLNAPQLNCNNTVSLSWATTLGANNYISNVTAPQGQPLSCATSNTGCTVSSLQCGQVYNVTVTALNAQCSSPASSPFSFTTAPCIPQNVVTKLDCITGVATVSWDSAAGAELYTANVVWGNEDPHSCNTSSVSCDISGLSCGKVYTATVTAANEKCKSKPSSEVQIQTAPCTPEQQPPQLNCETNMATLFWGKTLGASQYVSNVTAPGEQALSCATENTNCTISGLKCGLLYNATVTAINNQCRGPESTTTTFITVPCQPQNFTAAMNCTSSIAQLKWNEAAGALGYTSILKAPGGDKHICNSTTVHCEVGNLQCGQLYTVFVKAHNLQCDSTPSAPAQLHSVPCVPSNVQTQVNCDSDLATLSWGATNGAVNYSARVIGPQNEEHFFQGADLLCSFPKLSCGVEYNATVSAVGDTCNSDTTAPLTFQTVPCAATELNMLYECNKDTANLSWASTPGAIMYSASVSTQDGMTLYCNTTSTSCVVSGIKCGQRYTMAVESFGITCSSKAISPNQFPTAPCIPQNATSTINCQDNSAVLSWSTAPGAMNYTSLVTGPNGESHTCQTNSTTCNISALTCGFTYNVTVTAFSAQCKSENSKVVPIVTAPCAPENVIVGTDCALSTVTLSWGEVASAQSFISHLNGPDNWMKTCSNTLPTCNITGLPCGLEFSATIAAANSQCIGPLSNPVKVISAPCMPVNVYTSVECTENSVDIFWDRSNGSVSYSSTVLGAGGQRYHCSSEDLSCRVPKLHCGEVYSVIVFAENDVCSSQPSHMIEFPTSPCTPVNLVAQASINLVVLSWALTPGALNYTTQVTGINGDKHVCSTSNTSCSLQGLLCGQNYNMSVTAIGPLCSNISDLHEFQTGPCTPVNVIAEIDCVSNTGLVSWDSSPGAENYKAIANGTAQDIHTCNSTSTSCDFIGLKCGTTYSVVIIAANEKSNSESSSPVQLNTAPCVPVQNLPQITCGTNIATLSWTRSLGADSYNASVTAPAETTHFCSTNTQECSINGLMCGQIYSATVSAINTNCSSPLSAPANVTTVPCKPRNVTAQIDCSRSVAQISWALAPGALHYTSILRTSEGVVLMCNSTDLTCEIGSLQCGQVYTVTVTAFNDYCASTPSFPVYLHSVPCVPTEVHPEVNCASNVATVQWAVAKGAVNYTVTVTGPLTEKYKCQTANTSCSFPQLSCGLQYNASVVAVGHTCSSDGSAVAIFYTVPCVPSAVQAGVTCDSNLVTVTWNSSLGALNYTAVLTGPAGDKHVCQGVNTMCSFSNLSCGLEYNTTVSAQGYTCSSQPSATATIQAVPCRTTELNMQYNCNDDNAELSWKAALGALRYTATVSMQDMENVNCSTRQTSCIVYGINCGQIYTMTVETFGVNCNNNVTSTVTFPTAPCVPEQHPPQYSCDTNTASLSWGRTLGAARYISNVTAPNVETLTCNTSAMTCNITDFHCGQVYTSTVSGISTQCRSLESLPTTITTVPCQPQNVTATIDCTASVATVSWDIAPGALRYSATLQASGGEILMCNSTELGCQVKNLQCGQIYTVTVTAFNEWCQSASSSPIALISVPCVPTKVQADISCESNVVNVSWAVTPGAVNYTAVTSGPQGQQFICHALNRACTFPRLACGTEYNVTIAAVGNTCSSAFSQPISVQTVPCQPKNISAQMICSSSVASVSWYKTSGALRYLSTLTSSRGVELTCNSTNLGCEVGSLRCGESYSVSVSAFNNECEGAPSVPTELLSVPCVPSHVQAKVSCTSNNTIMSWAAAEGAVNYIGLLTGAHGEEYECQEVGTSCNFTQLSCGLEYNATVFSVGHTCSSNSSEAITVYTTPCLANDLHMQYQCGDDHATLSWGATLGALMYIASVTTQHGETLYCNSTTTSCVVSNIKCGKKYNMTVESVGRTCRSKVTFAGIFSTGPCVPQNFTAVTDCEVNSAVLSWSKTPGALNYTALAIGPDGKNFTCDTESTTCRIPSLHCGFTYNVSVIALNEQCVGESSTVLQLITAPCAPETLQAEVGCVASSITLSWEQMADAHSFTSYLTGHDGLTQTCNSTEKKCVFLNLPCGQIYSATVSAFNSQCTGPISNAISIETAPCIPTGIKIDPLCGTEMESLWWNTVPGADMYYAEVTGVNEWTSECITQNRTCNITGLACGQPYNITLTASNSRCNSTARPVTFYTAPCVPSNINAVVVCGMNTADISWAPTKGALNYSATVVGRSGKYSCSTKELTCNAELPQCGQTYTVTVTAVHDQCSTESLALQFHSAPCRPENVAAIINCDNSTASVTWDSAAGAQSYISNISGPNGEAHSCNTTLSTCDVGGMQCGHIYNVTVTAVNEQCSNTSSVLAQLKTGPCVPQILDVNFNCAMDFATLSWGVTPGAESYEAILIDSSGRILACNTTDQSCDISELICGENYNATVIALNDQCTSEHSPTVMVHAVPCPPDNINTSIYHANVKPQEVRVSWSSSHCGIEYMATLQGAPDSIFTLESYWTPYMEFFIPVPCSSSFNATVMARNGAGASHPSVPVQGYTAPCPPQVNVAEVYGETMRISWSQSVNTEEYRVLNAATNATLCVTASLACEIPFTENVLLVIAVNLSGESDPSILPGYNRTATP